MNKWLKYFCFLFLLAGAIEISLPERGVSEGSRLVTAGINGKQLEQGAKIAKKGWKWIKGCGRSEAELVEGAEAARGVRPLKPVKPVRPLLISTCVSRLIRGIEGVKTQEEILPKIEEYLSSASAAESSPKVITCLRTESNQVRMILADVAKNKTNVNKLIKVASKPINLAEYDLTAFKEVPFVGSDGLEYIRFVIPRQPRFVLDGQFPGRIYESMIFEFPKDGAGKWERIRTYFFNFVRDVMSSPGKLWNEHKFRSGLKGMGVDHRDLYEIQHYMFAEIPDLNGNKGFVQKTVA